MNANSKDDVEPWVTIITVTFNSSSVIKDFLSSLPAHENNNIDLIIVDNHSHDNSVEIAKETYYKVVSLDTNIGFGAACNRGAAYANTEFLFFVNPDCKFESDTISELRKAVEKYPNASAFNPRILNNRKPYFRKRSNLLPKSQHWVGAYPTQDAVVPILSGSSILCKRSLFEEIGRFDENIFLYYEDDDISLRFAKKGKLKMIYNSVIHHHFGHSSGRDAKTARFKGYHLTRSWSYSSRKHGTKWSANKLKYKIFFSLLMPHILFNKRRRSKYLGMLEGITDI